MGVIRGLSLLLIFLLSSLLSACTSEKKCTVTYVITCSNDVLENLQPIVKFIDGQNQIHEISLTGNDFRDFDGSFVHSSRVSNWQNIKQWSVDIICNDANLYSFMDVKFKRLSEQATEDKTYIYHANLSVIAGYEEDGKSVVNNTSFDIDVQQYELPLPFFNDKLSLLEKDGLYKEVIIDKKGNISIK